MLMFDTTLTHVITLNYVIVSKLYLCWRVIVSFNDRVVFGIRVCVCSS